MDKRLSLSSYLLVGSMLFGLFFGAGNLIFPVHMGQEAGAAVLPATIGFLVTAIGLPFLGIIAIGVSKSEGLFDLASRVHPVFAYVITILLYLTIGPFFALPRTGSVSFEIGLAPFIAPEYQTMALAVFTTLFFLVALFFALRPSEILTWVGKVLNPLFLLFLAVLVVVSIVRPMGAVAVAQVQPAYESASFFKGFTQGYQTMDVLASLAFGIIVVKALRGLGVQSPSGIAVGCIKSGVVTLLLMGAIYSFLAYMGASSLGQFAVSVNGGIALAQIAAYYFGTGGSILLALIVTLACLKTAVGLITACSETFCELFPKSLGYRSYAVLFTVVTGLVANIGLTQIITLSIPVLMFLYPPAIALVLISLLSPLFRHRQCVYVAAILPTLPVSVGDALNALPEAARQLPAIQNILAGYQKIFPFFDLGMGWLLPLAVGLVVGIVISRFTKPKGMQAA